MNTRTESVVSPTAANGVDALQSRLDLLRPYPAASPVRNAVRVEQAFRNFTLAPAPR